MTQKPILYLPVGIPGSGKSTYLRTLPNTIVISGDSVRGEFFGNENFQYSDDFLKSKGYNPDNLKYWDKTNICNKFIWEEVNKRVHNALEQGFNVGYDGTNLSPKIRKNVFNQYHEIANIEVLYFDVPLNICIERDAQRTRTVGEDVIRQMSTRIVPPTPEEGFKNYKVIDKEGKIMNFKNYSLEDIQKNPEIILDIYVNAIETGTPIDPELEQVCQENAYRIKSLPNEVKRDALNKMVCAEPSTSKYFVDGISLIVPEFKEMMDFDQKNPWHLYTLGEHTIEVMKNVEPTVEMRLAGLLHDFGKLDTFSIDKDGVGHFYKHASFSSERAHDLLIDLGYEEELVNNITTLVKDHDRNFDLEKTVKKYITANSPEFFDKLMTLEMADAKAQNPEFAHTRFEKIEEAREMKERVLKQAERLTSKDLAITGKFLMENYGIQGKEIGQTLNSLVETINQHPEYNTKEKLTELLDKSFGKNLNINIPEPSQNPKTQPEPGSSGMF